MGSVNQVDSCVGRSYDLIIFDEAALADGRDAFNVALRPTLDKPNSKKQFLYPRHGVAATGSRISFTVDTLMNFPNGFQFVQLIKDNPRMSQSDIDEARKSMSEAEFRQEYEADFNTYQGQIWKFDFENCVADLSQFDTSNFDVFAGLDVGYKDPTALCVIAYDWDNDKFYLVDEYLDAERTTEQHAGEIQKLIDRLGYRFYLHVIPQHSKLDLTSLRTMEFPLSMQRSLF